jgi:hypothetical protein
MVFDGQEVLIDNFDWNVSQVLRFMKMGQNIWESMSKILMIRVKVTVSVTTTKKTPKYCKLCVTFKLL